MRLNEIRKYYILMTQLLGASYCIYFIMNVQNYEVSWGLLSYAMPRVTSFINGFLSSTGTIILIIPLSIIIMSFVMPESYKLKLASSFFGTEYLYLIKGLFKTTIVLALGFYY